MKCSSIFAVLATIAGAVAASNQDPDLHASEKSDVARCESIIRRPSRGRCLLRMSQKYHPNWEHGHCCTSLPIKDDNDPQRKIQQRDEKSWWEKMSDDDESKEKKQTKEDKGEEKQWNSDFKSAKRDD